MKSICKSYCERDSSKEMASCKFNLAHNSEILLKSADSEQIFVLCDKLIDHLRVGVFLNQKRLKYSIHMITGANAFELYARDLSITWGDYKYYWKWTLMEDTNGVPMEVAELSQVYWLTVEKYFPMKFLTPETSYEVSFVLMMKEGAEGFTNSPVTLKFVRPSQQPVERTVNLSTLQTKEWKEIPVGDFVTSCDMSGDMEISMYEHINKDLMKKGLVVNKIIIRPVMNWKELNGEKNWDGLLNPRNGDLIKYITFYGERVDAIYDSINADETSPRYGYPKYEEKELFSKVGLDKDKLSKIYEVKRYIYAKIDVPFPADLVRQDRSTWIGYVAVATDEGKKVLGRRDILVCWRGTSSDAEWIKNAEALTKVYPEKIFPFVRHPKVHQGFYSIYTTKNSASDNKSARDQVFEEVRKWVNEYQSEEVSITVTGHSLGAALATMNAADIVANGYNMPNPHVDKEFLVTTFAFASPKAGDNGFKEEFDKYTKDNWKLRLLRIKNVDDVITKVPPGYVDMGEKEITISTTTASAYDGNKISTAHSLKNYIREFRALSYPPSA